MQNSQHFPDEIILEILSRLPVKSVGRFRCVSKPWRALLSQPRFIKTHLQKTRILHRESLILIPDCRDSRQSLFLASSENAHQMFDEMTISLKRLCFADRDECWNGVYGSCDGLLLVGSSEGKMFVVNPIMKEIVEVGTSSFAVRYGMGYDSVSDDYKIVSVSYYLTDTEHGPFFAVFAEIYSLKTGSWTWVESCPQDYYLNRGGFGVFVGGGIHWLARRTADDKYVFLGFNLAQKKFFEVALPNSVQIGNVELNRCGVVGGRLFLCVICENGAEIWVMREYGVKESWTKFTINLPGYTPLCLLSQERVLMVKDGEYVMYNLKEGTWKRFVIDGALDGFYLIKSFPESLVSPYGL